MTDIETLKSELLAEVAGAANLDAIEAVRVKALGKQGQVTTLLKTMGGLSPEERQTRGPEIHGLREAVTNALADRKNALELAALEARLASEKIDITLPVSTGPHGSIHPISQVMDARSEEHTSELQSLMRITYADFSLETKK